MQHILVMVFGVHSIFYFRIPLYKSKIVSMECSVKSSMIKINRCIDDPKVGLLDEEQEKTRKQKQRYFGSLCIM